MSLDCISDNTWNMSITYRWLYLLLLIDILNKLWFWPCLVARACLCQDRDQWLCCIKRKNAWNLPRYPLYSAEITVIFLQLHSLSASFPLSLFTHHTHHLLPSIKMAPARCFLSLSCTYTLCWQGKGLRPWTFNRGSVYGIHRSAWGNSGVPWSVLSYSRWLYISALLGSWAEQQRNRSFYLLNLLARKCWCYTVGIQMKFAYVWKFGWEREGYYVYSVLSWFLGVFTGLTRACNGSSPWAMEQHELWVWPRCWQKLWLRSSFTAL